VDQGSPGRAWFAYFRIYGPQRPAFDGSWGPAFDGSWKPGDFKEVNVRRTARSISSSLCLAGAWSNKTWRPGEIELVKVATTDR
jgi:hypothetical protein